MIHVRRFFVHLTEKNCLEKWRSIYGGPSIWGGGLLLGPVLIFLNGGPSIGGGGASNGGPSTGFYGICNALEVWARGY